MGAERDQALTEMLLSALEVMTSFTQSRANPGFYWQAAQRVLADDHGEDGAAPAAHLTFGLCALAGILLDDLSTATGEEPARILADLHRRYLAS